MLSGCYRFRKGGIWTRIQPAGRSRGGVGGPIWGVLDLYTIIVRARAYNDCVKERVLLKTRSTGRYTGT